MIDISDRLRQLDTSLFDDVPAQLTAGDKLTLLALHVACRRAYGEFSYLEIGSHLGGSLQTFVRDPACTAVISIDPRPARQPDERWGSFNYPENSTARMIDHLAAVPDADLTKLTTIEKSTEAIEPAELTVRPQLAFVDGEHTDRAALRDARFCTAAMRDEGCIVFHDAPIVHRALSAPYCARVPGALLALRVGTDTGHASLVSILVIISARNRPQRRITHKPGLRITMRVSGVS